MGEEKELEKHLGKTVRKHPQELKQPSFSTLQDTFSCHVALHRYSHHHLPPLLTPGTRCCPGLLQGPGKHLVAGLMVSGKQQPAAHTGPHGLQTRQRACARIPYTPRFAFHLEEAGVVKRLPCLFLIATRKANEPPWSQWGDMPHTHSSASFAASSPNMASSRQVPWKHRPPLHWVMFEAQKASEAFLVTYLHWLSVVCFNQLLQTYPCFIIAHVLSIYDITKHLLTISCCFTRK